MHLDPRQPRTYLGHFASDVTVVSCDIDGNPHGATVNAFSAVSLDPPLVLVSLDRRSKACSHLENRPFAVNVLREEQDAVASHFAGKPAEQPIEWIRPEGAAPYLGGSLAHISCRLWRSYDGGDHVIHLGGVESFAFAGGDPLVFYLGKFRHLGKAFETAPWLESLDCPTGQTRFVLS
ncbi:flavin reductase family protein [Bounagaea algeriensis]